MIGKLVKSEIAKCELSNSAARHLHFDSFTIRFINSGSLCSIRLFWGDL
jgi:hypothetical protein